MKVKKRNAIEKNGRPNKGINLVYLFAGLAVLVILLFVFWKQFHLHQSLGNGIDLHETLADNITIPGTTDQSTVEKSEERPLSTLEIETPDIPLSTTSISADRSQTDIPGHDNKDLNSDSLSEISANQEPSLSKTNDQTPLQTICENSISTIKDFYRHLDRQDYIKAYKLPSKSEIYFTRLIQNLLDNPPIVSGETNDLFTILQNTAHFFRILGKDNIIILKSILDGEKDQFEVVLKDFYSIVNLPACTHDRLQLRIPSDALYDYAAFFLNSMGGRLYLFRRDSKSRILVSYYAILVIDQSNTHGTNKLGIDIRPGINQLIEELESTSNTLILQNEYLEKLYSLQER